MSSRLAQHLQSEYTTDGFTVSPRNHYTFKFRDENVTIPKDAVIVVPYFSKKDTDLIVRCVKKISHPYILKLVDDYDLNLSNYEIVQNPDKEDLWGYATVLCEDITGKIVEADGEVHISNLKAGMKGYAYTMLRKRTEDRAVLRYFSLYQKGFYSESEDLGETDTQNSNGSVDFDSSPARTLNNSNNYLPKIQELAKSRNIDKPGIDAIAIKVLNLNTETVDWKTLVTSQLEQIYNEMLNPTTNDKEVNETTSEDVGVFQEAIKQYKIEQDWDNDTFKQKISEVLGKDDININTLETSEWQTLYKEFILNA